MENNENELIKLKEEKIKADKRLLNLEIVLGLITTVSFLTLFYVSIYAITKLKIIVLPVITLVVATIMFFVGLGYCLYIEQIAGYYECKHCHHKYVPTFKQTLLAPHMMRTRYLKCPHCQQKSWSKKVLK